MKILILLFVWMLPAAVVILKNRLQVASLQRRFWHDKILYAFCEVRDQTALAAVNKKISEDSEIFNFFYKANARLIHNNVSMGNCFRELIKVIDARYSSGKKHSEPSGLRRLRKEIQESDNHTKNLVNQWFNAFGHALFLNSPHFRLHVMKKMVEQDMERVRIEIQRMSKSKLEKREMRELAEFGVSVSAAAA